MIIEGEIENEQKRIEIVIPKIETIGENAFRNVNLSELEIKGTVQKIETAAFYIAERVYEIFSNCKNLNSIIVSQNEDLLNPKPEFPLEEDTIYQKDILWWPNLKKISLPETICESAFYGCSKITEIIFPESLKTIGFGAFWGCTALKRAVIKGNGVCVDKKGYIKRKILEIH